MFVSIEQITFYNIIDDNPLTAMKIGSCYSIRNTSVEISARKVLHLMLYMYAIYQSFVSLPIPIIVLYCTLCKDIIHWL
jgi:hypothetical protein